MNPERQAWLELHFAVLCFGFTAILGSWISLNALYLVWWRTGLTTLSLILLLKGWKVLQTIPTRMKWQFSGIGIIVGLHWVAFYGAIKLSNASVTLICLATTSLFTAILEPMITSRRIQKIEILLGVLVIPGMMLIAHQIPDGFGWGMITGLVSAFLAALFSILNKQRITFADPKAITMLELGAAFVFLSLLIPFAGNMTENATLWPTKKDWLPLIILSLVCTTLAYILSLRALRHLSAFAANLTINLEPVYGILLAIILLNEHQTLTMGFYVGVGIILAAVLSYPFLKKRPME